MRVVGENGVVAIVVKRVCAKTWIGSDRSVVRFFLTFDRGKELALVFVQACSHHQRHNAIDAERQVTRRAEKKVGDHCEERNVETVDWRQVCHQRICHSFDI